jgi:hypothetical protein
MDDEIDSNLFIVLFNVNCCIALYISFHFTVFYINDVKYITLILINPP